MAGVSRQEKLLEIPSDPGLRCATPWFAHSSTRTVVPGCFLKSEVVAHFRVKAFEQLLKDAGVEKVFDDSHDGCGLRGYVPHRR